MNAPTLLIGLGGVGCQIVELVSNMVTDEQRDNIAIAAFDTDVNELRVIKARNPHIYTIQTSTQQTVGEYLSHDSYACDTWFPVNNILNGKALSEGAGQVRSISRLAFETAMQAGKLESLHEAIQSLFKVEEDKLDQSVRVIIVSTLAGGTGSGLILPVGLYVRQYLETRFHKSSNITRGFFILPEVLFEVIKGPAERNNIKANAYATLRELDAFLMKGDKTLARKYRDTVKMNFPRETGSGYEEYNVRPYDYCFLFDAQNADGGKLNSFEQYKEHAANCIYSQSIGPMNKRSNSSEDNTIRKLVRENGRNRYAGAGVSMLIYPSDDIKRFVALNWAKRGVSDQWLAFDRMFKNICKENEARRDSGLNTVNPDPDKFYVQQIDAMRLQDDPFAKAIYSACGAYEADGVVRIGNQWELYIDTLEDKIERDLAEVTGELDMTDNEIKVSLTHLQTSTNGNEYVEAYELLHKYLAQVETYVNEASQAIAYAMFTPPGSRTVDRKLDYKLEYFLSDKTNKFIHPNAVRYFLINALDQMKAVLADSDESIRGNRDYFENFETDCFDDPNTEQIEGASEFSTRKVSWIARMRNCPTDDQADVLRKLNQYYRHITEYKLHLAYYRVFTRGTEYLEKIIRTFDQFYTTLDAKIAYMENSISEIYKKYTATKGTTVRYVCASETCLNAIKDRMVFTGSSISVDSELSSDIYYGMVEYAFRNDKPNNNKYFGDIFEKSIIGYFEKSVMRLYGDEIDVDIITAIEKEADYSGKLQEEGKAEDIITRYTQRVINDTRSLSCPFIESPIGEHREAINACTFNSALKPEKGDESPKAHLIDRELMNYGGVPDEDISKNMIMFYKSFYGLRANDLSKFAPPEKFATYSRSAGEYYKAYFDLVSGIHPIPYLSKELSPHIDRNWHIVTKMPDIDDENQLAQEKKIYAAFFWGIAQRYVDYYEDGVDEHIYRIKVDALKMNDSELYVSNGTKCDRLYEVLDAIAIFPELTDKILAKIESIIEDDINEKTPLEEGLLYSVLESFSIEEPGIGADNAPAESIFDIPVLMRKSATTDDYFEEDAIQIIKVELEIIRNYLSKFCEPKELPDVATKVILRQFETYLKDMEKERAVRSNIYREPLFDRTCSVIEEEIRELGKRKEADAVNRRVKQLRKSDAHS